MSVFSNVNNYACRYSSRLFGSCSANFLSHLNMWLVGTLVARYPKALLSGWITNCLNALFTTFSTKKNKSKLFSLLDSRQKKMPMLNTVVWHIVSHLEDLTEDSISMNSELLDIISSLLYLFLITPEIVFLISEDVLWMNNGILS